MLMQRPGAYHHGPFGYVVRSRCPAPISGRRRVRRGGGRERGRFGSGRAAAAVLRPTHPAPWPRPRAERPARPASPARPARRGPQARATPMRVPVAWLSLRLRVRWRLAWMGTQPGQVAEPERDPGHAPALVDAPHDGDRGAGQLFGPLAAVPPGLQQGAPGLLADPQDRRDAGDDQIGLPQVGQLDEPCPVGELSRHRGQQSQRQPGCADASGPAQGQRPRRVHQIAGDVVHPVLLILCFGG